MTHKKNKIPKQLGSNKSFPTDYNTLNKIELINIETRKYLPTFAELVDRLSIVTLKSIFIPANKEAYDSEAKDIIHDINLLIKNNNIVLNAEAIRAIQVIQLANRYIWENESKCRSGDSQDLTLLKLTHSINGVRNTAKNVLSKQLGERVDLKIDCLAAELQSDFENWDIFK